RRVHRLVPHSRAGHDQCDVSVVVGSPAVFGDLLHAAGVNDAVLRDADEVGGVAVAGRGAHERVCGAAGVNGGEPGGGHGGGVDALRVGDRVRRRAVTEQVLLGEGERLG